MSKVERSLMIEFVGIAGAGKTTLLNLLVQKEPAIQAVKPPPKTIYLPYLAKTIMRWLPLYLRQYRSTRWFSWTEIKMMVYLEAWPSYLKGQLQKNSHILVLNPGSACWLTKLRTRGPEITQDEQFDRWWNQILERWADLLDVLVWLEAPVGLLVHRVLTRDDWHEVKALALEKALDRFARYQRSYKKVVGAMTDRDGPTLMHFETDRMPPEEVAARTLTGIYAIYDRSFEEQHVLSEV
jgi:deoxyadenosine/deoxycytidine kinase